jgi:hypothetical protein
MRKVLGVLVALVAIVAAAAFVFLKKSNAILDSGEVERIAARLLPGARPPSGLKGVLALKPDDLEVAIFAPDLGQAKTANLEPGGLRIIIARPESQQAPQPTEVMAKISQVQKEQAENEEILSKHPLILKLGGQNQPAQECQLKVKSNGKMLRQDFTVALVEKHPVILLITGTEPQFNQTARDQFLAGLSAPGHPGLPRPGETPGMPGMPELPRPPGPGPGGPPKPPGGLKPPGPGGPPKPPGGLMKPPGPGPGPGGPPKPNMPDMAKPNIPKPSKPSIPKPSIPKPGRPHMPGPPDGEGPGGPPSGPPGGPPDGAPPGPPGL